MSVREALATQDQSEQPLDMVVAQVQQERKPVCKNCLNTGIEFGVYKNFQCSFCIPPAPEGDKQ